MRRTINNLYKLSLALPLLVPILSAILLAVIQNFESPLRMDFDSTGGVIVWLLTVNMLSGLVGGIPYVILAAVLLWWMRGKSESQIRLALLLSPIIFLGVCSIFFLLGFSAFRETATFLQRLVAFVPFVPFVLGNGYFYVAVTFGLIYLLRRRGLIYN